MKNRVYILFLLLFLSFKSGSAQDAGFQGRRNEFSIDAFNLAYQGDINLMYKFAVSKSYMIYLNYINSNLDLSMKNPMAYGLKYSDQNTQYNYNYDDIVSGETKFKMTTYGFGFLGTSNFYNMNMPVGIYYGMGFYLSNGESTDIYTLKSGLPGSGVPIKYDVSQFSLRFIYGTDFVLTGMLTMDIAVTVGFTSGKYTLQNPPESGIYSETPFATYPQVTFAGYDATQDWNVDYYGTQPNVYKKFNLFFAPTIRLGYMF